MEGLEVLVSHQDRVVVRVDDTFFKVDAKPEKPAREERAMRAAPVPTAEVLWRRDSVLALRRVPGSPLDDDCSSAAWSAAGAAARRLHEAAAPEGLKTVFVPHQSFEWLTYDRRWLFERALIDPALFETHHEIARDNLAGRTVDLAFLHGDLQAVHVFVDGDEVTGIIDWADACLGDPLFDVAVLTGRHLHRLDDVLAGYGTADRDVVRGWWSLRQLGELRWMVEHGYDIADRLEALQAVRGA